MVREGRPCTASGGDWHPVPWRFKIKLVLKVPQLEAVNLTVYRRQEFEQRTFRYLKEFWDRLKRNHPNVDLKFNCKVIQREGNSGVQMDATTPEGEIT